MTDPTVPPQHRPHLEDEVRPDVPPELLEPVEHSFEAPGQPEKEMRTMRRRTRRRAEREGTNPSADDLPDVVPPRPAPREGEEPHERWLREQRPPHWE